MPVLLQAIAVTARCLAIGGTLDALGLKTCCEGRMGKPDVETALAGCELAQAVRALCTGHGR